MKIDETIKEIQFSRTDRVCVKKDNVGRRVGRHLLVYNFNVWVNTSIKMVCFNKPGPTKTSVVIQYSGIIDRGHNTISENRSCGLLA